MAANGDEEMYKLHDFQGSGNGYKVRLALTTLGLDFTYVETDILNGGTRTPEFLALSLFGRIPLLSLPDGRHLAESNAILCYLAEGSKLMPEDAFARAQVMSWLFFEQSAHEPYLAVMRFWRRFLGMTAEREARAPELMERGHAALAIMEHRLQYHDWLASADFTIADIALYAYTHVAPEGGFVLDGYPGITRWLARVAERPGHIPITRILR